MGRACWNLSSIPDCTHPFDVGPEIVGRASQRWFAEKCKVELLMRTMRIDERGNDEGGHNLQSCSGQ